MRTFDFDKAISKWSPVIENTIMKHKYTYCRDLIEAISIFCEWFSRNEDQKINQYANTGATLGQIPLGITPGGDYENPLPGKLKDIYEKLKYVDFKIEIIGEYLNMVTGQIEYKLSDGSYVLKDLKNFKPSDEVYLKVFDHDFITFWRPDIIRDCKLDKILNNGRDNRCR
jgi:hypothetical protein